MNMTYIVFGRMDHKTSESELDLEMHRLTVDGLSRDDFNMVAVKQLTFTTIMWTVAPNEMSTLVMTEPAMQSLVMTYG